MKISQPLKLWTCFNGFYDIDLKSNTFSAFSSGSAGIIHSFQVTKRVKMVMKRMQLIDQLK